MLYLAHVFYSIKKYIDDYTEDCESFYNVDALSIEEAETKVHKYLDKKKVKYCFHY